MAEPRRRGRPTLPEGARKISQGIRLSPAAWGSLDNIATVRGTTATQVLEEIIMTTAANTVRPATDEETAAWHAGNNDGAGYAPDAAVESAIATMQAGESGLKVHMGRSADLQSPNMADGGVWATVDGKTVVADSSGWWAVDIARYLA